MRIVGAALAAAAAVALGSVGACGSGEGAASGPAPREFVGVWVSDTLPALASPGRVVRLEVRADTQAALSTEFIRRGTVFVSGFWRARGSEFTLQPVDLALRPNALPLVWRLEDGRLVPVRWNRDVYGEAGIPLHRPAPQALPADTTGTEEGR